MIEQIRTIMSFPLIQILRRILVSGAYRNISAKYDKKNKQDGGAIVRKVCSISFLEENNKN